MAVRFQNILEFEQHLVAELRNEVFCFVPCLLYRWKAKKYESWGGKNQQTNPNQNLDMSKQFFLKYQISGVDENLGDLSCSLNNLLPFSNLCETVAELSQMVG